jgi:hypothetical protein
MAQMENVGEVYRTGPVVDIQVRCHVKICGSPKKPMPFFSGATPED